jgi:hypothetical protein
MRRDLIPIVALLMMMIAASGCEDLPTDPTPSQRILGDWKSSKVGAAFTPAADVDIEFKVNGELTASIDGGARQAGSYTTLPSSTSVSIRTIDMSIGLATYKGIYDINGTEMKLEVVSKSSPPTIEAPTDVEGIGSTRVNGVKTMDYVTVMQRQ